MASFTEIANELAKTYVKAKNKKYALNQMIFEINYLSDPKSKQPLDFDAKSAVLKLIHDLGQYLINFHCFFFVSCTQLLQTIFAER